MKPKLGWIGLGNMGKPMATNLIHAGYDVTVYNRTPEKMEPLVALGAKAAGSPRELAEQVDVVITMVSDGPTLESVLFGANGVAEGVRSGQTVIDMSTVAPETSRMAAEQLDELGVSFLDAPVSGSVKPATEGTLVILVGGKRDAYREHLPIFDVLGKQSFYFGENGQGANAKLVINLLLGVTLQAFSEALVLGAKMGLNRDTLLDMISASASVSPIMSMKMPSIKVDSYEAAFALKHMNKDFGLALDVAKQAQAALPSTSAAHQTFLGAMANGLGDQDIMAVLVQLEKMSGLR